LKTPELSDQTLALAILNRTPAAAGLCYDRYAVSLYRIIILHVQNEALAETVLEEVFVDAWNHISQFDPTQLSLKLWLAGKARKAAKALLAAERPSGQKQTFTAIFPDLGNSLKLA
jgi:DNA-directed RNA polymerase specialized sigma24 family protein